ncbi:MAG: hypothetical protein ACYC6C_13950 [Coriobacteriia bacterium]
MNIDTTDPKCIEALAEACAVVPARTIIEQALREVIDADRAGCLAAIKAIPGRDKRHDAALTKAENAIRARGGK